MVVALYSFYQHVVWIKVRNTDNTGLPLLCLCYTYKDMVLNDKSACATSIPDCNNIDMHCGSPFQMVAHAHMYVDRGYEGRICIHRGYKGRLHIIKHDHDSLCLGTACVCTHKEATFYI